MKILVTGGCGFIASQVVDAYIAGGHDVVIIDNLSSGKRINANPLARLYVKDICEPHIEAIFEREKPDVVNHHAAQISVPLSVREPLVDAEINIKGTIGLLQLSLKHNVQRFIFASTGGAIYGDAREIPTGEGYCAEPESPYGIAKLSCEHYIRYYRSQHGLSSVILRYSNVFGPRQIAHGEAGVVAIFTEQLLGGVHPKLFYYVDKPEGMVRDYCFVKDIVRANVIALERGEGNVFNIGTGKGTATIEVYETIVKILRDRGKEIPSLYDRPLREIAEPGNVSVSTLDPSKALEGLGWEATCDLPKGLSETIDWYISHVR